MTSLMDDFKNITPPQITVHKTTLRHLDFLEKILFNELQRQGRVQVIDDETEVIT